MARPEQWPARDCLIGHCHFVPVRGPGRPVRGGARYRRAGCAAIPAVFRRCACDRVSHRSAQGREQTSRTANRRAARPRRAARARTPSLTGVWPRTGANGRERAAKARSNGTGTPSGPDASHRGAQGREQARTRAQDDASGPLGRFGRGGPSQRHAGPGMEHAQRYGGCGGRCWRGSTRELTRSRCEKPRIRAASTGNSPDRQRPPRPFRAGVRSDGEREGLRVHPAALCSGSRMRVPPSRPRGRDTSWRRSPRPCGSAHRCIATTRGPTRRW